MFNNRYFGFFIALMMAVFFIIMYVHFSQKLSELQHLRQTEKKMRMDLQIINRKEASLSLKTINKVSVLVSPKPNKISDILQNIIQVIEENGFTIQTLKPPELKGAEENIFPVTLLIKGSMNQIVSLLTHLSQNNWTMGIQDFSLKIENDDKATIEMTVLILKQTNENTITLKHFSEPFKVIGYVHDDKQFYALLLFPDGKTQIVKKGISQGQKQIQLSQNLSPLSQNLSSLSQNLSSLSQNLSSLSQNLSSLSQNLSPLF